MEYDQLLDDKIYEILKNNCRIGFNTLLKKLFPKYIIGKTSRQHPSPFYYIRNNQQLLRQHLKIMLKQKIIEIVYDDPDQTQFKFGKPQYYRLTEATKFKMYYNLFEGVKSNREGKEDKIQKKRKNPRFKDLSKIDRLKIAYQLLLSYIGQGSFLLIPTDSPKLGDIASYNNTKKKSESFSGKSLPGFRISELIDRKRNISSIEEINESYTNIGPEMKNYIYTDTYTQLAHPKNRFLYLELSQQEIEECIKLLEDEKYPIIRKSGLFNGEILYNIENGDKMVSVLDNNEEINNTTFIISCDYIFDLVFNRMRLIWMFKGIPDEEHVNWFQHIYGDKMMMDFFLHIKEQRQEYENRIKEHFQGYLNKPSLTVVEREKFIKNQISKIVENRIKDYDKSIKRNLVDGLEKKYGNKVKIQNKIFYDLMLEIIYPPFLRKEYSIFRQ